MTNPYPLPRETRETSVISGDGRATYGPLNFKIWDGVDVVAFVSREAGGFAFEAVTVEKTSAQPLDDFSVTFTPALQAGDLAFVQAKRVHERLTDVIRGGALSGAALEAELSRQGTVLQELRRDLDRAFALGPGTNAPPPLGPLQGGRTIAVSADGARLEYGLSTPELIELRDAAEAARDAALLTNGSGARYVFSAETNDADPGDGKLRLSATQQATALTIRADALDMNGVDVSGILDAFDDSTSATKGRLRIYKVDDPTKWLVFDVTALASPAGYRNITVENIAASETSPFEGGDTVLLSFQPAGERGSDGVFSQVATQEIAETGADNIAGMTSLRTVNQIRYSLGHINLFDHMTRAQQLAFINRTFEPGGQASLQAALDALPSTKGKIYVPECGGKLWMDDSTVSEFAARGIGPYHVRIQDKDDWIFDGGEMEITATDDHTLPQTFFIFRCNGHEFGRVHGIGNNTGLTAIQNNGMFFQYCATEFYVHDISTDGYQGSQIVGNFQFDAVYENIKQKLGVNASGFDVASWQNMKVINHTCVGQQSGQGFHMIYDFPNSPNNNPGYNETGKVLRENRTNNIRYTNPDVSGCVTGVSFSDVGGDIYIKDGRIWNNGGATGDYWCGVLFQATAAGVSDGGGASVNLNIEGTDIYSNGRAGETSGLNGGVLVNSNEAVMHLHIHPSTKIHDNATAGIVNFGASVLRMDGADFRDRFGALQTTKIRNPASLKKPTTALSIDTSSLITNCPGINPVGFVGGIHTVPAVPAGTGVGNLRRNTNPYPCRVSWAGGAGVAIRDARSDFESVVLGDPKSIVLQPGEAIFFTTTVPSSWQWYGL
ncbi:hypothetical protein [Aurantimonas coralicida]|uniref:hypothetical protein n=1 Tax=Aurantimonas coralicida TaxID=182270 RepID=UPI0023A40FBA|nr:hypothetical protein [Aurantimonas coralicida]MDE0921518.1 hypothetical protein [Aurantimonas coralicida]